MIRMMIPVWFLFVSTTGCVQANGPAYSTNAAAARLPVGIAAVMPASDRDAGRVDLPRYPSISPDGSTVVFSWRGDLWKVAAAGGHAERLSNHPGNELRSAWSADGTRIAFESDRSGWRNVFIMNADGTDVDRVTDLDRSVSLAGFGLDAAGNEVITLDGRIEGDNYRAARPYLCSVSGGDLVRLHDAFGSNPRLSPDSSKVAFTRGGARWARRHYRGADARDVWLYDNADGSFRRLTNWAGNDGKARWAGTHTLVFISDRKDQRYNIYTLDVAKGGAKPKQRTSFTEVDVQDLDVSADGSTAVLSAWDTLYTLDLKSADAKPVALAITANQDEGDNHEVKSIDKEVDEAALSPDGKVMAYIAYGEVYVRNLEDKSPTRRVHAPQDDERTAHARERHVAWSPDGLKLYFVSDRSGTDAIYAATVATTREEVKEDFEKATKPPEEEKDEAEEETKDGATDEDAKDAEASEDAEGEDSDDDDDDGDGDDDDDDDDGDDKDKKKKKKKDDLPKELQPERWGDALTFAVEPVVVSEHNDRNPRPSPDGKSLAFKRGRGDLVVLDFESGETRPLARGWDTGIDWRWSPDSRHIAYQQGDLNFNTDIWIVPADASMPPVNITRHPDDDFDPRWSADGKILAFLSERVSEENDVWMVFLDKDLEVLTPREREKYYEDAVKAAKKRKPLKVENPEEEEDDDESDDDADDDDDDDDDDDEEDDEDDEDEDDDEEDDEDDDDEEEKEPKALDLDDAYLRVRRVTTLGGSENNLELTPGGDRYIFTATIGKRGLYSVKWDGKDRKRLSDGASVQHVSLTGDKVVLVSGGRAGTVGPAGKEVEYVDIADKMRIDLQEQAGQKFLEMARYLGENFYHPTLKGLDWPALTEAYHALARQTRTGDEFNWVGMRLFGELNGSHLGVYSRDPRSPNAQSQGRLGTVHKRVEGGYEIVEVVPDSPASKGAMALKVGDVVSAVDLVPIGPRDTLESRLTGRAGQETIVTIKRLTDAGEVKELKVLITPISGGALDRLKYDAWRKRNADLVSEATDGKVGYIHIRAMSQPSLDVFERDLFAAAGGKDGLIIDVRNNGGGWTADRLLASIMVRPHAYTIPRGADPSAIGHYPQGRLFIQRYTLPINMLCNEKSFSNAEIISHAFKTLKRGTLVGRETYGAVISTGGFGLIDGTFVRMPFRGWYVLDGTDMENHGARPHIVVEQTPEDESRGEDEQLKAALTDLLKRLP